MVYLGHHYDRSWQQSDNAEPDDQPSAADIAPEDGNDPDEGLPNALFDPLWEDRQTDDYIEALLSGPEPDEGNPYHGNFYDFDDEPY